MKALLFENLIQAHQDSVLGKMISLHESIEYHNREIAKKFNEMEAWEVKEYQSVQNDNIEKLALLQNYITAEEKHFDALLSTYNYTVSLFLQSLTSDKY